MPPKLPTSRRSPTWSESVVTWFFASNTLSFLVHPVSAFRPKSGSSCLHSAFRHSDRLPCPLAQQAVGMSYSYMQLLKPPDNRPMLLVRRSRSRVSHLLFLSFSFLWQFAMTFSKYWRGYKHFCPLHLIIWRRRSPAVPPKSPALGTLFPWIFTADNTLRAE